jgi:uncharacterized protein YndB with AHSA1/START domain
MAVTMNEPPIDPVPKKLAATLVVRRRINAAREKLFAAWTQPELLVRWWGPQGVACPAAEINLRVGGPYSGKTASGASGGAVHLL